MLLCIVIDISINTVKVTYECVLFVILISQNRLCRQKKIDTVVFYNKLIKFFLLYQITELDPLFYLF